MRNLLFGCHCPKVSLKCVLTAKLKQNNNTCFVDLWQSPIFNFFWCIEAVANFDSH